MKRLGQYMVEMERDMRAEISGKNQTSMDAGGKADALLQQMKISFHHRME